MKRVIFILVLALSLVSLCGCGGCGQSPSPAERAAAVKVEHHDKAKASIPAGAKNVVNLGGDWYTFELDGQKFLYKWWYGSHGEVGHTVTRIDK